MKILALESSAVAASAAVCEDEFLLAQVFQNSGLTHSRTLLPMVESMLDNCGLSLDQIELIAVASGPGSFTGLRIGLAAAKGLAWAGEKRCCGVSTLEAMAWNAACADGLICCAMDARRKQVYNALFRARDGELERLTEDRAISLEALFAQLDELGETPLLVGDGAELCLSYGAQRGTSLRIAPAHLRYQSAWGVARGALELAASGRVTDAQGLEAAYLRLSQAERERQARLAAQKET